MLDPRSDPEGVLDGIGITVRAHEMKHVQCSADAYEWGEDELGKLSQICCGGVSDKVDLATKIQEGIQWKMLCCSADVDATDYNLSTNEKLKEKVENKKAISRQACSQFSKINQEISDKMKTLKLLDRK